jgi:hypothetical protein
MHLDRIGLSKLGTAQGDTWKGVQKQVALECPQSNLGYPEIGCLNRVFYYYIILMAYGTYTRVQGSTLLHRQML